jgi:two-component system, NtrC family, response regulator HydG
MNGVDAFRHMKKLRPDVSVVLMTAFALESLLDAAMGEGAYTVVSKPFSMEHLFRIVGRAVDRPVILVVDRELDATSVVESLRKAGLRAEAAHDGDAALRRVTETAEGIDVCVLDLANLGAEGLKTQQQLNLAHNKVAVIALTTNVRSELVHGFMSQGGYACLRKPYDVAELVRAIARARGESAHP